jgi:hypothetical protein
MGKVGRFHSIFSNRLHIIDFDVIVHPKRKSNKWTANIEHASLDGLKEYIRKMYQPPALENDGAELNMLNDSGKSPEPLYLFYFCINKKFIFTIKRFKKSKASLLYF